MKVPKIIISNQSSSFEIIYNVKTKTIIKLLPVHFINKAFSLFMFLIIFFIYFFPAYSSTIIDDLQKKINTSLSQNNIQDALMYYNDLFAITFKDDKSLLEKICLEVFEGILKSQNQSLKKEILPFLEKSLNISLGRVLVQAFYDPDANIRKMAIEIFSRYHNDVLYPEISVCLQSGNLYAISSALEVVRILKEKHFREQLKGLLDYEDILIQAKAIEVIAKLEPDEEIVEKLNKLLNHPSEQIRKSVLEAFIALEGKRAEIEKVLKDGSPLVRISLLRWAAANPDDPLFDQIVRRELQANESDIFAEACRAVIKNEKLIRRVKWERLTGDQSESLRLLAYNALAQLDDLMTDEEKIRGFLRDPSLKNRKFIALKLLQNKDVFVEGIIEDVLEQGSFKAREAILTALIEETDLPVSVKQVKSFLNSQNAVLQAKAIPLIERLQNNEHKSFFESLIRSNKYNVSCAAFKYLIEQKKEEFYREFFVLGIQSPFAAVQAQTIQGVHFLSESERGKIITEKMKSSFWIVRESAMRKVGCLDSESEKWEWIAQGLKDSSEKVRIAALKVVSELDDKQKALEIYSDSLFDENEEVRSYALMVLESPGSFEAEKEENKEEKEEKNEFLKKEPDTKTTKDTITVDQKKTSKGSNKLMDWLNSGSKIEKDDSLNLKKETNLDLNVGETNKNKKKSKVEEKLKQLLQSKEKRVANKVEDWLLQMGDEQSLANIKNRLSKGEVEERLKAAEKLGFLRDTSLIPVLREQLSEENDSKVQFQIAFAIWKMLPGLPSANLPDTSGRINN